MTQVYGFLLIQETCSALLDWFVLLEHTGAHWKDQNQHWWDLYAPRIVGTVARAAWCCAIDLFALAMPVKFRLQAGPSKKMQR